ncbi:MAG: alpha/beta hydrolase [Blastocatellia bacterium]|nr:alpha/beta hydrolase [Blastocatellia bacterium]
MKTIFQRSIAAAIILNLMPLTMDNALGARCVYVPAPVNKKQSMTGNYAEVNGLKIYYEVHGPQGADHSLVLLHGGFGYAESWAPVLPALAKSRRVIAIELEGHGHTRDLDRPLSFQQMTEDTAALLRQLKIKEADIFGYSMGGVVALGIAIRHPDLVRKLAILGSSSFATKDAFEPETYQQVQSIPDDFAPAVLKEPYDRMAPDPTRWPMFVKKVKILVAGFKGYPDAEVKTIKAKTLIMQGDRDAVRPEKAVELFRLIPNSQLAILPGSDHFVLLNNPDRVISVLLPFLDS